MRNVFTHTKYYHTLTFLSEKKNHFPHPEAIIYAEQDYDKVHNYSWLDRLSLVPRRLRLQYYKYLNNDGIHVHVKLLILADTRQIRIFLQSQSTAGSRSSVHGTFWTTWTTIFSHKYYRQHSKTARGEIYQQPLPLANQNL